MALRKLSADTIYPVASEPIANGCLIVDEAGTVQEVLSSIEGLEGVEFHKGALVPGFVNAHCHLELSHLRGKVPQKHGLIQFIHDMMGIRFTFEPEQVQEAIATADAEMLRNGIVAVGDITNGSDSFAVKSSSKLRYHSFFELFNFDPDKAHETIELGRALMAEYQQKIGGTAYVTPHAPYSVSEKLMKLIGETCYADGSPISMHNQENAEENGMFLTGESAFLDMLRDFKLFTGHWKATGYNSLPSVAVHLPICNPLLFVHNTFTSAQDIAWAHKYSKVVYWCTCPKANLYIEDRLPDYQVFLDAGARMTIGTDSLASNDGLSILEEMKVIAAHANIDFETLLEWGTLNGAKVLGMHKAFGSFEAGKQPGVNLVSGLENGQLVAGSKVERLV